MKRWFRRFIYVLLILIWLAVMSFPFLAFTLATQNEIQLGESLHQHVRIFLVQEERLGGVGIEWARLTRRPPDCSRTTVVYLMWEGDGQSASFVQCFGAVPGG